MNMLGPAFFYLSSFAAIAGGLGTILSRNAIRSAVSLLLAILGIAGLYVCLSAQLLAAVQLIVYAGAIVVLFVFVIMMLGPTGVAVNDNRTFWTRVLGVGLFVGSVAASLGIVWHAVGVLNAFDPSTLRQKPVSIRPAWPHFFGQPAAELGTVRGVGREIFGDGLVAFELSGLLLLVAIVAVMAIGRGQMSASAGDKDPGERGRGEGDKEAVG